MPNDKTTWYADLFDYARAETLRTAEGVPPEARLRQLKEGKATPLWLLGHLANTVNVVVLRWNLLEQGLVTKEQSRLFAPDFAGGMPPSSDASMYPDWDEVVALYDAVLRRAVAGLPSLEDSILPQPVPGKMPDPMRGFFSSVEFCLRQMTSHDAYHRGQIALIAKL